MTLTLITPADLSLPAKFISWRPGQLDSILAAVSTDHRFISGAFPTGYGKSAFAVGCGLMNGGRTVVVTSTKLLSEQYSDDFAESGMTEMRGQSNFPCHGTSRRSATCADGRILNCEARKNNECPYLAARDRFLKSNLCVTNYDYLLTSIIHGEGCGPIDLLVLDEAHSAVQQLSDALTIKLVHHELMHLYEMVGSPPIRPLNQPLSHWRDWAGSAIKKLREIRIHNPESLPDHTPHLEQFKSAITQISAIPESDWVAEHSESESLFSPIWPTEYAHRYLFGNAKKVLLISATLVRKTLTLLDIPDSDSLWLQTPYSFPSHRSPVYLFGAHRIDYRTTEPQWAETLGRMDSLISNRLDRKGIIHSVSYIRQKYLYDNSQHWHMTIAPKATVLREAVTEFRKSPPPRILNSPALTTGYDFPGRDCEFQMIVKMPFVDTRGALMQARIGREPEYAHLITAQNFMQMCGRPMRGEKDQNENLVLDKHAEWFLRDARYKGFRHLFADWFLGLVRYVRDGQPMPPPPLEEGYENG